ncbi:hypothetical protein FLR97_02705 [Escherichia coli]|nr:hypothetical protein [Escherichia coli]PQI95998.1 hypothetical protein C5U38_11980 [Escherichia fergusonii]
MGSACRLSTNVIRLSKSITKHSLRSFLHCAECVFLAPSGSAKFIAFWCKKNRRATICGDFFAPSIVPFSTHSPVRAQCAYQPEHRQTPCKPERLPYGSGLPPRRARC